MKRIILLLVSVLFAFNIQAAGYVSPDSWFLEVNDDLARKINSDFGIKIDKGLYYSNQRDNWYREDVSRGHLIDEVSFVSPDYGDDNYIGFSTQNFNNETELWLISTNKTRFLLAKYDSGTWNSKVISKDYMDWFPVLDGVAIIGKKWGLKLINYQGDTVHESGMNLYHHDFDGMDLPLYHYDAQVNRIVVAVKKTNIDVIAMDLNNYSKKNLVKDISWPFYIRNSGVFFTTGTDSQNLEYKKYNLVYFNDSRLSSPAEKVYTLRKDGSEYIDEFEFSDVELILSRATGNGRMLDYVFDHDGKISRFRAERTRFAASSEREDEIMAAIEHVDLLSDLKQGRKTPIYGLSEISRFLADQMGEEINTISMLRYDKGQMPEELIASFVWDIITGAQGSTYDLSEIDRVWLVDADKVFSGLKEDEITDLIRAMREAVERKNAVLVLKDLPTVLESETGATTPIIKTFYSTFRDCMAAGTCRVITTMREKVFANFNRSIPDVLREFKQYIVPKLSNDQRENVAEATLAGLERKKGIKVDRSAFQFIFNFASKLGRTQESPLNEIHLIKSLFTYVDTYMPNVQEISRQVGKSWIEHMRGIDVLRKNINIEGLRKYLKKKIVGHDDVIDSVCEGLRPLINGTHFSAKPLGFFAFTGTPGVGKTYIAKMVAEYLTGKDSLLLVDMKTFGGFQADHPVRRAISTSKNNIRVVLFDDVDQVSASNLDLLAGVVEEGRYAQGSNLELSFSNTIVIWTANWGEDLIRDGNITQGNFRTVLRRELTAPTSGGKPMMKKRIWSRIESNLHVMWPFSERQLFELALVHSMNHMRELFDIGGIELRIDPRLLIRQIAYESDVQAGARSILNQLESKIFVKYQRVIGEPGVDRVCMLQVNAEVEVFTNLDDDFEAACNEIEDITENNIDEFVRRYGVNF